MGSQCSFETRVGSTGEEEQVEVCRDIPIEDCQLVKEENCIDGELEEVEECDEENEIEDSVTTENVASDVSAEENVLENNYDEILDAVNTIFGSGSPDEVAEGEEEVSVSNDDVTTTEAEPLATEESVQTSTILPSEPITISTTTTTSTTATDATTFESSSSESTDEIDTEAIFVSSTE